MAKFRVTIEVSGQIEYTLDTENFNHSTEDLMKYVAENWQRMEQEFNPTMDDSDVSLKSVVRLENKGA